MDALYSIYMTERKLLLEIYKQNEKLLEQNKAIQKQNLEIKTALRDFQETVKMFMTNSEYWTRTNDKSG